MMSWEYSKVVVSTSFAEDGEESMPGDSIS